MSPTPARVLVGISSLVASSAALIALAREPLPPLLSVALGVLFCVPLCSLGEWAVHALLYHRGVAGFHRIATIHSAGHHLALFPPHRYVQHGRWEFMRIRAPLLPYRMAETRLDSALTSWGQVGLHFVVGVPGIVLPAWLGSRNVAFTFSALVTLAFISWMLAYLHGVLHTPRQRWIERQRWFAWLDRHHYVHHVDHSANLNFMLPLCDWLFGTRKPGLTPDERARHPAFEDAKYPSDDAAIEAKAA